MDDLNMDEPTNKFAKSISGKPSNSFKEKFLKIFSTKNIKIIILIAVAIILAIMLLSINYKGVSSTGVTNSKEYISTLDYCEKIEEKLESIISSISGAGNVKVMVTVEGSPELIYASDTDTKTSTNSGGTITTSTSSPIIIKSSGETGGMILTKSLPQVKGVVVVSSGANIISIKLDILRAVSTVLDLPVDKITILKGQ